MQLIDLLRVTKWSVQGSNLRPPVLESTITAGVSKELGGSERRKQPSFARRTGETAKPKDNETTIVVPHVLDRTPTHLLFLVRGFV